MFLLLKTLKINLPAYPQYSVLDFEVAFQAMAQNVSTYLWDFGDGSFSDQENAFHTYATPGTYQASLTIGSGCVDVVIPFEVVLDLPVHNVTFDIVDINGQPINNAVVTLEGNQNSPGVYLFELIQGVYSYSVELDGFPSVEGHLVVTYDDLTVNIVMQVEVTYQVTFQVTDVNNQAISDAVITLGGTQYPAGQYIFDEIVAGSYPYTVSREGYLTASGTVVVVNQDVVETVVLHEIFQVTFQVNDDDGQQISDAVIAFDGTQYPAGQYVFQNIIAGTYPYTVSRAGYIPVSGEVVVVDQDVLEIVVLLEAPAVYQVTFNIVDADENDIADAVITFDGNVYPAGQYVFQDLLPGTYAYEVSLENFTSVSGQVEIIDQDITVVVTLQPTSVSMPLGASLRFFPNPATDKLFIDFSSQVSVVRVVNLNGQVVIEQQVSSDSDNLTLNVSSLRQGAYILHVVSQGKTYQGMFIKK
jgi:PKD repeat protein